MDPDIQDSALGNLVWLCECGVCGEPHGNLSLSGHWSCPKWAVVPAQVVERDCQSGSCTVGQGSFLNKKPAIVIPPSAKISA